MKNAGVYELREVVRVLERRLGILNESDMSCCGVTMAQCHALVEVGRAKNLSLKELSEILGLDSSTTSRTVNNLVTLELVTRNNDAQDRRYVSIALTEKGDALFRSIEDKMNRRFAQIYAQIPDEKSEAVVESLRLLIQAMGAGCC